MSKASRAHNAALETGVVADLTHEGEGVVRGVDITDGPLRDKPEAGKTVFIAGALPGERVTFRRRGFHNVGVFYRRLRAAAAGACEA